MLYHCPIRPGCLNLAMRMSPSLVLEAFSLLTRVSLMKGDKKGRRRIGQGAGDGALCVGASSVEDILNAPSRITPSSGAMSGSEVKFVRRAAIRLERGAMAGGT